MSVESAGNRGSGQDGSVRVPFASRRTRRPIVGKLPYLSPLLASLALAGPALAQDPEPTSGSLVVGSGGIGQSADQTQSLDQGNDQSVGDDAGSIIVGDPGQTSGQNAQTNQHIGQQQSGTFVVFNDALHQRASQDASTSQQNTQSAEGTIIGSPQQSNQQDALTNQDINQSMEGTFIVFGGTRPINAAAKQSINRLNSCELCADALVGGPTLAGGNLNRSATGNHQSDAGIFVVFGDFNQTADQESSITETNHQATYGDIIIGSPGQANTQSARTDQDLDQSLKGTFIVFGELNQDGKQKASTTQVNLQEIGPG